MRTFMDMQRAVMEKCTQTGKKRAVLVASADLEGLEALHEAYTIGLVQPLLIGDEQKTRMLCADIGFDLSGVEVIDISNNIDACKAGVKLCKEGSGDILIKGQIKTADFLRPILNKETGIKTSRVLSINAVAELDILDRLVVITDVGMLIKPTLQEKVAQIENAAVCAARLSGRKPKAAVVCAVEVVNEAMPETVDAAILAKMSDRGQIKGAIVDGPLALDNALSKKAADIKGITSSVAGDADILVVPDIHSGNILIKSLTYISDTKNASYIHGALVPVLSPSRSDSRVNKFNSIILALFMA